MHVGFTMFEKMYVDGWQVTTRRSLPKSHARIHRYPDRIWKMIEHDVRAVVIDERV